MSTVATSRRRQVMASQRILGGESVSNRTCLPTWPLPGIRGRRLAATLGRDLSTRPVSPLEPPSHHISEPVPPATMEEVRSELLALALEKVPVHGWTAEAVAAALQDLPPQSRLASPDLSWALAGLITPDDLVGYAMDAWKDQLRKELQEQRVIWQAEFSQEGPARSTRMDRIFFSFQRRLGYMEPLLQSKRWHEGMARGAHPPNVPRTQRQLQELVELVIELTRLGPDEKVMNSFEAVALGMCYVSTELHLLADGSPGYVDTWTFLRHRLDEWERAQTAWTTGPMSVPDAQGTWLAVSHVVSAFGTGMASLLYPHPQAWQDLQAHVHRTVATASSNASKYAEQAAERMPNPFQGTMRDEKKS